MANEKGNGRVVVPVGLAPDEASDVDTKAERMQRILGGSRPNRSAVIRAALRQFDVDAWIASLTANSNADAA